jgi:CRISPR system Cascade subunit CasA
MNEDEKKFNLITQPWIPCRMNGGSPLHLTYLGIEDVLKNAHTISEIVGENPLVTISLHRLLLAVLYRCYGALSYNGEWQQVWKEGDGVFEPEKIKGYLHRKDYPAKSKDKDTTAKTINIFERFYLFDDEHPFYQFAGIQAPDPGKYSTAKLLFHDEGSAVLFEHLLQLSPPELDAARAIRLLIAFHSFDVSGLKSRLPGVPNSAQISPLLKAAVSLARGKNLFQTLMLNLYWDDRDFFKNHYSHDGKPPQDLPTWENDEIFSEASREPIGYLELLTWQSRRIKLFPSSAEKPVTQVVIVAGNSFTKEFRKYDKEPMIAYRKSTEGYFPITLQPDRALWRDSHAVFQIARETDRKHSLLLLDWLANLNLSEEKSIPIDFFGMTSEKGREAKLLFWRHERLPLPIRYLQNEDLLDQLKTALALAESTGKLLKASVRRFVLLTVLHENDRENPDYFKPFLSQENRKSADEKQKKYEAKNGYKIVKKRPNPIDARVESFGPGTHYWPRLENVFRVLLLGLAHDLDNWSRQREQWAKAVKRTAGQAMQEIIGGIADSTRTLRAASISQSWFEAKLNANCNRYMKEGVVSNEFTDPDESDEENEQNEGE